MQRGGAAATAEVRYVYIRGLRAVGWCFRSLGCQGDMELYHIH